MLATCDQLMWHTVLFVSSKAPSLQQGELTTNISCFPDKHSTWKFYLWLFNVKIVPVVWWHYIILLLCNFFVKPTNNSNRRSYIHCNVTVALWILSSLFMYVVLCRGRIFKSMTVCCSAVMSTRYYWHVMCRVTIKCTVVSCPS